MTQLLLAPSAVPADPRTGGDPRLGSSGLTLDELITGAWRELRAGAAAPCPVCGQAMTPRTPSATAAGDSCQGCGSQLS